MDLNLNQLGSLIGKVKPVQPNVYDLVTGNNRQDVTTSSLRGLLQGQTPSNLTQAQEKTLSTLESYINDNVSKEAAPKLLESLSALRGLLELNSTPKTQLDPIFALLGGNADLTNSLKVGSLLDVVA